MVSIEPLHPVQLARLQAMTPAEKWAVFRGMVRTARAVRRAAHRNAHPKWTEEEVDRAVAQEFARART